MDRHQQTIIEGVTELAAELPDGALHACASVMENARETDTLGSIRAAIVRAIPQPAQRARVQRFLDLWEQQAPTVAAPLVAMALRSAGAATRRTREAQRVELVWTGPLASGVPMRRTDQALLQVIQSAKATLLIVSFAVYKLEAITDALIAAANRGVAIRICVEAPEPSGQRMAHDTIKALGPQIAQRAAIYVWPNDQRTSDSMGNTGVLHAKCAVADHRLLFISSANLTGHAMQLNIELGSLIEGGPAPATVVRQFEHMISAGILKQIGTP